MDLDGPVNAMNAQFRRAIGETVNRLEGVANLKGVIITSAKSTFFAGGDLAELAQVTANQADEQFKQIEDEIKAPLRRLEKIAAPVVAAINGAALGGGLEIGLACNYRIAVDSENMQLGLPEVTLGLLPGAGGMVRLIHRLGAEKALPLILDGNRLNAAQALEAGLIDATVTNQKELLSAAFEYIESNPDACTQPWDQKGHQIKNGNIWDPKIKQLLSAAPFQVYKKTRGLLPAPEVILSVASNILATDFDSGMKAESRGLVQLTLTAEAKNMINTLFFQTNAVNSKNYRPAADTTVTVTQIAIFESDELTNNIAFACEQQNITISLNKVSQASKQDLLTCQLIIVNNNSLLETIEPLIPTGAAIVVLNPKQPVDSLTSNNELSDRTIGLHWLSSENSHPVVEICCTEKTSINTAAIVFNFVRQLRKTPIVLHSTKDSYLTRITQSYVDEGERLLNEGSNSILINNLGKQLGMPKGPIEACEDSGSNDIAAPNIARQDIKDRLLFRQVIEALNCYEQGIVRTVAESNVAAIQSQTAPTWSGGFLQFVNTYGLQSFKARCDSLTQRYGERFAAPNIIEEKLTKQQLIAD
ncbi:hypothetical protein GCM10025791_13790 [Halioxenophilus aromaticivorans]|uniref:3-hydroxyacyl-CoA dehydrogenase NAD binding domain-containing protein n=2 Tax=Halioxenophilus aromaticivorans TaxID=1306992 RepID=A0AAV3U008_9ALTE